ncbi:MAG TPA: ribosome maturation factor RimM [Caldilineaceae bacterium]|nr:ribosome maturation factor RimM [Caldilineaceae bacterium]
MAVGLIAGAHGLRGEVKVELHTDFPERFAPGSTLWLGTELEQVEVATSRPHQGQVLVRFEQVTNRSEAEALRGEWLFIHESEAETLEEGTYFVHDIIGASVQTVEGRPLGVVREVLFTGANEVYVIESLDQPPRELLLPAIADVIQQVDLEANLITVALLPGLLDEEADEEETPEE